MAVYQKNKIQEDVRTALDQNMNSDTLKIIGDVDTLALDDIIASKILEAVKRVHSSAPSYLLDAGRFHAFCRFPNERLGACGI